MSPKQLHQREQFVQIVAHSLNSLYVNLALIKESKNFVGNVNNIKTDLKVAQRLIKNILKIKIAYNVKV